MKHSKIRKISTRGAFSEARSRRLDSLLRDKLRELTKGRCESCGVYVTGFSSQLSHGFTRKIKSLRWDRLNVAHLCASCHWNYTNHPPIAESLLRRLNGHAGYEELLRRWQRKTQVKELDYDLITAYINDLKIGIYPDISTLPLWELGK